jgi:hypothetical protein
MRRAVSCAIAAALGGCTADPCDHRDQVVAPSSSSEPGTLQSGELLSETSAPRSETPAVVVRSDGTIVCVTCAGITAFDPSLHVIGSIETRGPAGVAVTSDDALYAVLPGRAAGRADIVAISPSGAVRWRSTILAESGLVHLIASDDGLYAAALPIDSRDRQTTLFAIDPATGAQHTVATGIGALGPAHRGVMAIGSRDIGSWEPLTVEQIEPDGTIAWSHTLRSTVVPELAGSVATADGGVIVFGTTLVPIDLGDRQIAVPYPNRENGFVIGFDATGATQWAFAVGTGGVTHLARTATGQLLIASKRQVGGGLFSPQIDTYLATATPTGVSRSLTIDGAGIQEILGLAAAPDGAAWIQVQNAVSSDDDDELPPIVQIGDRRFPNPGVYLFKLVP